MSGPHWCWRGMSTWCRPVTGPPGPAEPFTPVVRDGRVVGPRRLRHEGRAGRHPRRRSQAVLAGSSEPPPFAVHFVVGEEDGGLGAYATLARGHTGDACIIPEPTELRLVTANAGSLTFRIEVPGQATHGSTRYEGHSAIDAYLPIHAALAELERRRNADPEPLLREYPIAYPLSVGRVRSRGLAQQRARPAGRRGPLRPADRGGPGGGAGRAGGRGRRGGGTRAVPARPSAAGLLAGWDLPRRAAATRPSAGGRGGRGAPRR